MLQKTPAETGQFDAEFDAPEEIEPRVQRLNPLFDFLHATLDRIQDVSEFLLLCVARVVKTWIFRFTSGLVAGLLFISFAIWLVKATIGFFTGDSPPQ
jgi:hypothetical protein